MIMPLRLRLGFGTHDLKEPGCQRMSGPGENIVRQTFLGDRTVAEENDAIRDFLREAN